VKRWIPSRYSLTSLLLVAVIFWSSCAPGPSEIPVETNPLTIVFVHGAWAGGWHFTKVQPLLEQAGHTVYRPTMTGLGERVHLAGPEVGLSTHIEDIVKVLEFEDLDEIVLVGHSYGGMVIAGVAERVPQRRALAARASMGGGGEAATGRCATAVAHLYRANRTRQPAGSAAPGSISLDRRSRKRGRRS